VRPLAAPEPAATASRKEKQPATATKPAAASASTPAAATKSADRTKPAKPTTRKSSAVAKAPPGDIDFPVGKPVDEVEILDADEVTDESASDDDWLNALDSLAPKAPAGSGTTGAPAPVAGKPKKKKVSTGKSRRRSLREPDGEFRLWLSRIIMIGTGALAGVICMVGWAALTYHTGRPSSYMAMFIGASVGTGVRLGASKWDFGWFPAITASVIALLAIFGGKIYGVHSLRAEAAREFQAEQRRYVEMLQHPNYPIHLVAQQIEMDAAQPPADMDADGDTVVSDLTDADFADIPEEFDAVGAGSFFDPQELPGFHDPKTWEQAASRWETMADPEKAEIRGRIDREIKNASVEPTDPFARHVRVHGHTNTAVLSIFDFVFAAIALVMAFRIAAGFADAIGQTDQAQY
jgi:hypothetical protein